MVKGYVHPGGWVAHRVDPRCPVMWKYGGEKNFYGGWWAPAAGAANVGKIPCKTSVLSRPESQVYHQVASLTERYLEVDLDRINRWVVTTRAKWKFIRCKGTCCCDLWGQQAAGAGGRQAFRRDTGIRGSG